MDSKKQKIDFRKLKIEDGEAIAEMIRLITKNPVDDTFRDTIRRNVNEERHGAHFVVENKENGELIGFIISYLLPLGFIAEKSALISTMGVHPSYMGKGIGSKIINEITKFFKSKGITRIYTSARWDYTDLLSFCKSMDFNRSDFEILQKGV